MKNDASERYLRYEKLKTMGLPVPAHVWTRVDEEWNALERLVSGKPAVPPNLYFSTSWTDS